MTKNKKQVPEKEDTFGKNVRILKRGKYRGFDYAVLRMIWERGQDAQINGYIRVPKGHIAFEIYSYNDIPISVHGGLTYLDNQLEGIERKTEDAIWIGFDTGHAGDLVPSMNVHFGDHEWTQNEVEMECFSMIDQLIKLTWKDVIIYKLKYEPEWFKKRVKYYDKK